MKKETRRYCRSLAKEGELDELYRRNCLEKETRRYENERMCIYSKLGNFRS
jgi:hypothetical protein